MAKAETTHTAALIPKEWPGGLGLYKHSKAAVAVNLGTILSLIVLLIIVPGIVRSFGSSEPSFSKGFFEFLGMLASSFISVSFVLALLRSAKGKKIELADSLKQAPDYFLNMIVLNILTVVILGVSLLLLVVPFFFVMPRISLAQYFLVDKNLDAIEALKASWEATRGNVSKVWSIIGVAFLFILLIFTIIGIPFAVYFLVMYSAASAVLYKMLTKKA